jgi:hypothetical protein
MHENLNMIEVYKLLKQDWQNEELLQIFIRKAEQEQEMSTYSEINDDVILKAITKAKNKKL